MCLLAKDSTLTLCKPLHTLSYDNQDLKLKNLTSFSSLEILGFYSQVRLLNSDLVEDYSVECVLAAGGFIVHPMTVLWS